MHFSILGFLEFFIVLLFAIGWLILEYVGRRLDAKRKEAAAAASDRRESTPS
jgi:cytochrome bd-type quinol oxidase subunit 1